MSCWAEDLVGGRGPVRVLASWTVLVLLTGLALVAGLGPLLLLATALGTAAVLLVAAAGRSWHRTVMVVAAALGVVALVYAWVAWGAAFDAVDTSPSEPVPAWAGQIGPSLLLAAGCAGAFVVVAALSLRRRRGRAGPRQAAEAGAPR